jgi:lipid-A-disaccharide synthase
VAGLLVLSQAFLEGVGVVLSPLRLLIHVLFFKNGERRRVAAALANPAPALPPPPPRPPRPSEGPPLTLFISAGEASGETHAANFIEEFRARVANVRFIGFGGPRLRQAGAETALSLSGEAGMGLVHGLAGIPKHIGIAQTFVDILEREKPAACIFIDNPGFHLILASLARRKGVPAIQYICPQTWAWAPWRWRRMKRDLASMLAIAPFEIPYFESRGLRACYVGHPIGDDFNKRTVDPTEVERWKREGPLVTIFPGSRRSEVRRNLPALLRVARRIRTQMPEVRFVIAARDAARATQCRDMLGAMKITDIAVHEGDNDALIAASTFAIAKSGTGTLEIALHGVPQMIVYRLERRFDYFLAYYVLTVRMISMLNLLSNRIVVPEVMYQSDREEETIYRIALDYLQQADQRIRQLQQLQPALARISAPGAAARAAEEVSRVLAGLCKTHPQSERERFLL